jgi:hypothetical protein
VPVVRSEISNCSVARSLVVTCCHSLFARTTITSLSLYLSDTRSSSLSHSRARILQQHQRLFHDNERSSRKCPNAAPRIGIVQTPIPKLSFGRPSQTDTHSASQIAVSPTLPCSACGQQSRRGVFDFVARARKQAKSCGAGCLRATPPLFRSRSAKCAHTSAARKATCPWIHRCVNGCVGVECRVVQTVYFCHCEISDRPQSWHRQQEHYVLDPTETQ